MVKAIKVKVALPFSQRKTLIIFAVSDTLALFSSSSYMLMFLSVLTSPHPEDDFLFALLKGLIIGHVTLFFSIIFMMTAFEATLYLVFENKKKH